MCGLKDKIKIGLQEIGREGVDWINLSQNSGRDREFWTQQLNSLFHKIREIY
jgi:hypothetical protein